MTVETNARFLTELNENYPRKNDLLKEGDDHIRLIKNVLKNTFPAIDREVTFTSEKLNQLDTSLVYDETSLKSTVAISFSPELTININKNRLINAGDPIDPQDAVTLKHLHQGAVWPVGSIYMTVDSRNPSLIFGYGVWEEFSSGRGIVGSGTAVDVNGESRTFNNEETGGFYYHTLTEEELANHSHDLSEINIGSNGNHTHSYNMWGRQSGGEYYVGRSSSAATERHVGTTPHILVESGDHVHSLQGELGGSGEGDSHSNIQPYIACNIWKRIE